MKTKDQLKKGDIVWINYEHTEPNSNKYLKLNNKTIPINGISKPIAVIVEKVFVSAVTVVPINEQYPIDKITCYENYSYDFYETYEEALTGLITEMKTNIEILKTITSNLESNIVELLNENNR